MKNFVWLAAGLLALSFMYPNGPDLKWSRPESAAVDAPTDDAIVKLLAKADIKDKHRIQDVYEALIFWLRRDAGTRVITTEQWAELAANTQQTAIETPGKYPGLDAAIEAVFLRVVGTDDVLPNNAETQKKLIEACELVANSAKK